jgi:hypothetical protein
VWLVGLELAVDGVEQDGGEDDPAELVPVKEGKAENCGRCARIELGEAEAKVGQRKQHERPPGLAIACGGVGRVRHGRNLSIVRGRQKADVFRTWPAWKRGSGCGSQVSWKCE